MRQALPPALAYFMLDSHELITLAITAVAAGLICLRRRQLADALNEAFNNFRGGPRPPSHPLPGDDAFIVRRKRSPVTNKSFRRTSLGNAFGSTPPCS